MAYILTMQYTYKGKIPEVFVVNPEHRIEISGEDLVELLSKFIIEMTLLQRKIHEEELLELRTEIYHNDDIPF